MLDPGDDFDIDDAFDDGPPEGHERRSTPRIPMRLGVRFNRPDDLALAVKTTTHNIGLGGLCLRTRRAYEQQTPLELVIELGDDEVLEVSAVVAWTRPGSAVGVRFQGLTEAQRARLEVLLGLPPGEAEVDFGI